MRVLCIFISDIKKRSGIPPPVKNYAYGWCSTVSSDVILQFKIHLVCLDSSKSWCLIISDTLKIEYKSHGAKVCIDLS